jgi:hypothetical protein
MIAIITSAIFSSFSAELISLLMNAYLVHTSAALFATLLCAVVLSMWSILELYVSSDGRSLDAIPCNEIGAAYWTVNHYLLQSNSVRIHENGPAPDSCGAVKLIGP